MKLTRLLFSSLFYLSQAGTVVKVYGGGTDGKDRFNVNETVMEVEDMAGKKHNLSMSHFWPVRMPRPVAEKLPGFSISAVCDNKRPLSLPLQAAARLHHPGH